MNQRYVHRKNGKANSRILVVCYFCGDVVGDFGKAVCRSCEWSIFDAPRKRVQVDELPSKRDPSTIVIHL